MWKSFYISSIITMILFIIINIYILNNNIKLNKKYEKYSSIQTISTNNHIKTKYKNKIFSLIEDLNIIPKNITFLNSGVISNLNNIDIIIKDIDNKFYYITYYYDLGISTYKTLIDMKYENNEEININEYGFIVKKDNNSGKEEKIGNIIYNDSLEKIDVIYKIDDKYIEIINGIYNDAIIKNMKEKIRTLNNYQKSNLLLKYNYYKNKNNNYNNSLLEYSLLKEELCNIFFDYKIPTTELNFIECEDIYLKIIKKEKQNEIKEKELKNINILLTKEQNEIK